MRKPEPRSWSSALLLSTLVACGETRSADAAESGLDARLSALVQARPQARRAALLVGLDRYAPEGSGRFPELSGCANDVRRMEAVLTERFEFDPADVFVLLDEEATHANIVTAFARVLIDRAGPETEAVFYLAGHGSRVPDRSDYSGAEPDRLDSTYVAYDSRAGGHDGEHDLSDDELRSLVSALASRTAHVTVITDSCHSGGALRGSTGGSARAVRTGSRPLDLEWVRSFWPADVALTEDAPDARLAPERYVHIAACRREQSAWEYDVEGDDGSRETYGALTHFLCQGLERSRPGDLWRTVLAGVGARLATEVPAQSLTASGALEREAFGGRMGHLPGIAARAVKGNAVVVEAGALFGLRPGSELRMLDARGTVTLGRIRIERVSSTNARGLWIDGGPTEGEAGLRGVEELRSGVRPPLRVATTEPAARAWLAVLPVAELVALEDRPDYLLGRGDAGMLLSTNEGIPLTASIPLASDGREALAEAVAGEQRWRSIFGLGAQRGSVPLVARMRPPTGEELRRHAGFRAVVPRAGGGDLSVEGAFSDDELGRMVMLEVTNPHDVALYLHVLSVSEDRFCNPIHPAPGELAEKLPPGASQLIPVSVLARRAWPLERPMRDRFLVLATRRRADFEIFRAEGALRDARVEVPAELRLALEDELGRGATAAVDPSGWGVTPVDLLVARPERGR